MTDNCKKAIASLIAVSICVWIASLADAQVKLDKGTEFVAFANAPRLLHRTLMITDVDAKPASGKFNFSGSYSFTWAGNKKHPRGHVATGFFTGHYTPPNGQGIQSIVFQCDKATRAKTQPYLSGRLLESPPAGPSGQARDEPQQRGSGPGGIVALLTTRDSVGSGATDATEYEVH